MALTSIFGKTSSGGSGMFNILPLIGVMVIAYNVIAFVGFGGDINTFLNQDWAQIRLVNATWVFTPGAMIITMTLLALFYEVVKSTQSDEVSIMNHGLSMLVFVVALIEFIVLPKFATDTFFLIAMMALVDAIGGPIVTIRVARRDIGLG
jgi:hypothetical protein